MEHPLNVFSDICITQKKKRDVLNFQRRFRNNLMGMLAKSTQNIFLLAGLILKKTKLEVKLLLIVWLCAQIMCHAILVSRIVVSEETHTARHLISPCDCISYYFRNVYQSIKITPFIRNLGKHLIFSYTSPSCLNVCVVALFKCMFCRVLKG